MEQLRARNIANRLHMRRSINTARESMLEQHRHEKWKVEQGLVRSNHMLQHELEKKIKQNNVRKY